MTRRLTLPRSLLIAALALVLTCPPALAEQHATAAKTQTGATGKTGKNIPPPQQWHPPVIPPGWPKVLIIPSLKVRASVEDVALTSQRDYEAPFKWDDVAWYDLGARPGEPGRAVFFGHLDSLCCPAVFYELKNLNKGALIQVQYRTGKILTFKVGWSATYLNNQLPIQYMYGPAHDRGLILVTCAGIFHRDGTGYDHKLLVYAHWVS